MDAKESVFEEVRHLPEVGVGTLKLFMAYKGTAFYCDDEAILSAMMNAKDAGVTMMVHAENADIITILTRYYLSQGKTAPVYHYYARPPIAEEEATGRAIALAKAADCPLFVVHVSIREAMEAIRNAHNDGWPIFGETCTHYLTLTTDLSLIHIFIGLERNTVQTCGQYRYSGFCTLLQKMVLHRGGWGKYQVALIGKCGN